MSEFCPCFCPIEELVNVIETNENPDKTEFYRGVYHYRVILETATNGQFGS
jgi:hypothetical protein